MTVLVASLCLSVALGVWLPLRFGIWGFLAAATLVFLFQLGFSASQGFAGESIQDSLLLFNGSYLSYLGFHLQITYRAFALPVLGLALPLIYRLSRA